MPHLHITTAAVVVTCAALNSPQAGAQTPSFTWFGPDSTEAYGVSADGQFATGRHYPGPGGSRAFRRTNTGIVQNLGLLYGNHDFGHGNGISGDGSVVVGVSGQGGTPGAGTVRGFRWSAGGMSELSPLAGHNYSSAEDVSADGSVSVGGSSVHLQYTTSRAVKWDANGVQNLGVLPGTIYSYAYGVSDDGSTAVGYSAAPGVSYPMRWRSGTGMQQLTAFSGTALAASTDGSVVVGDAGGQAFRWSQTTGMQFLGVLPGHFYSSATGVSADGSVVVGFCSGGGNTTAFRWVVGGQMQSVGNALLSYGLPIDACWACSFAYDVSADGTTIVGDGCYPASGDFCTAWIAAIPVDRDDDGLLDPWENQFGGIDGDGNGTIDLNLWNLGARPDHKDLFVEVDAMAGVGISPLAESMLFNAFSFAPFTNPDGIGGIELHLIDLGVDAVPFEESWDTDSGGCWPVSFTATKNAHFGSPGDSNAIKQAKARAFRYCVAINQLTNPGTGSGIGGCGYVPGRDFVIAIGGYDDESAAAVLMHELGHNLGLDHGGGDDINGKPNYVSIMNYALSYRSNFSADFWRLDYSRSELDPLVESDLDEALGVNAPAGFGSDTVYMPYGYDEEDAKGNLVRRMQYFRLDGSPVDWDRDGLLDRTGPEVTNNDLNYAGPTAPVGGLNTPGPDEVLAGFDDWAHVELPIPGGAALAGAQLPGNEPPPAPVVIAWLNANVPQPCPADIAPAPMGDQEVNVNDLLAVITAWGPCPAPCPPRCAADIAPIPSGDCAVNVNDLLAVITSWGACQ